MNKPEDPSPRTPFRKGLRTVNMKDETIRIGNEWLPVIGRQYVNGRVYLLLKELTTGVNGGRFQAFDPKAGLRGELRRLMILPRSPESVRQLSVLQRLRQHENLFAHILDLERSRDDLLIVMDWVPGPTLRTYLTEVREGRLPRPGVREAFRLGRDLARNLCKLHRRSFVVHGDLNPENLILNRGSSRLVLIDFGSSWAIESSKQAREGDGLRAVYSAPEMEEESPTPLEFSDQFVATLLMYEMLTLVVPYEGLGGKAGWSQHRDEMAGTLVPPSSLHKDFHFVTAEIRKGIDQLVLRGLSFSPADRFSSNVAWLQALDQVWAAINEQPKRCGINEAVSKWIAKVGKLLGIQ